MSESQYSERFSVLGVPVADVPRTLFANENLRIAWLGECDYQQTWLAMKEQVQRMLVDPTLPDQLWLLHHKPVYTLGTRGLRHGLLRQNNIPIVHSDRGGDVTYHGPGQLIAYPLLNLLPLSLTGASFVHALERLVMAQLAAWGIDDAVADADRPGVYVDGDKVLSLGLRCKRVGARQVSYHGFALNVALDLSPFLDINPCGYAGQRMINISEIIARRQLPAPFSALSGDSPDPGLSVAMAAADFAQRFLQWYRHD